MVWGNFHRNVILPLQDHNDFNSLCIKILPQNDCYILHSSNITMLPGRSMTDSYAMIFIKVSWSTHLSIAARSLQVPSPEYPDKVTTLFLEVVWCIYRSINAKFLQFTEQTQMNLNTVLHVLIHLALIKA